MGTLSNLAFSHNLKLVTEECCACGVVFAMPSDMQRRRRVDGNLFYCPAGHGQHYTKSELDRTRELLERAQRQNTVLVDETTRLRDQRDHALRQFNGMKGAHAKIKRRVAAGCCPCCQRSFQNLQRHMASQHPGYTGEGS